MSIEDVSATEQQLEHLRLLNDKIEQLERRRRLDFDADLFLNAKTENGDIWAVSPSGLRLKVKKATAQEIISKDLEDVAEKLHRSRDRKQKLEECITTYGLRAEDLVEILTSDP